MRTPRVYVDRIPALGETFRLPEDEGRHVLVLRRRAGDRVELLSADGVSGEAVIDAVDSGEPVAGEAPGVVVRVVAVTERGGADRAFPLAHWTLALSIVKGAAFDLALRTASELGFGRVDPIFTERTVVRWSDGAKKRERFERLLRESAKQCGRSPPLELGDALPLEDWLERAKGREARRWIFHVGSEPGAPAAPLLGLEAPVEALVLVGPEGGFAPREVELAVAAGFTVHGFPTPVLRTPTAVALIGALGLVSAPARSESPGEAES